MKFLILDVYPADDWRLVKDTAGGYGTGNDFGNTFFSKALNKFVMHFGKKAWVFLINMYLKNKNIFHYLILLSIIFICSYFWNFIELPYKNDKGSIGALTLLKYNHFNDTLRYLFFMFLPIFYYHFFIYKYRKKEIVNYKYFFY